MGRIRWLAVLFALAAPPLARARPAVVRVFEAEARAEPRRDAPVVARFAERVEVSVGEEAQDGWRRVRLADGGVGWIEDAALALLDPAGTTPAPPSLAPPPPPRAPPGAPDLRPRIYVKDVDHLAELMASDPDVGPRARALSARRTQAYVIGGIGIAASLTVMAVGMHQVTSFDPRPGDPDFGRAPPGRGLMIGAGAGLLATAIVVGLVHPKYGDLLDVVNAWNVRHPDRPFELEQARFQPASVAAQ